MPIQRLLTNATLVTPAAVVTDGALLITDGRIAALGPIAEFDPALTENAQVVDLDGAYVLPGLIDLHTDTLEKEITPRPAADFPIEIAIQELDRKMVACGITTVFHSLHIGYQEAEWSNRSRYSRRDIVGCVREMAAAHTLARTRIHLRYEIVGLGTTVLDMVNELLEDGHIDLLSFMDHTPGQGQYTRERFISQRVRDGISAAEAEKLLIEKMARPRVSKENLRTTAARAMRLGIPIASHDDDTAEKVREMRDLGVTISEFPVTVAAATEATSAGLTVLGGASNVLRGGSLTGNLDVTSAIQAGVVDGLCSDYYPPAMLHAAFKLAAQGVMPLPKAIALVSAVPARAMGLERETGSLAPGLVADLIVVRTQNGRPVVHQTYIGGERVHMAGRETAQAAALLAT